MGRALYKILVDDILRKISTGDIAVGERLPPEAEYAGLLGVSRSTLRQAFGQLELYGVIKRRKRGGTEVISRKPVQRFNMLTNGFYDVLSVARDTVLTVTDLNKVKTDSVAELASFDSISDCWLECTGNRFMAGQDEPFAVQKIFVPKRFSDVNLQVGETTNSMLAKIEEHYGVTAGRVKRQISAGTCSEPLATLLGLKTGDAVLTILTEIDDVNGELLEFAQSTIDPARFNISTDVVVGG